VVDVKLPSRQRFFGIGEAENFASKTPYLGKEVVFKGSSINFYRTGRFAQSEMDIFSPKIVTLRLFYSFGSFTGSARDALNILFFWNTQHTNELVNPK
jgi:hypothetical protein